MKKLAFSDIKNQQLVDVRGQFDYQAGHLSSALNLNPSNFKKYATNYLETDEPLVFLVKDEEVVEELTQEASEMHFTKVDGYVVMADVPEENLERLVTISPEDFLKEESFILLDVRHPDEITRPAPKKNLVNIPFEDLKAEYSSLDSDKTIYTLCGSGNRSTAAASYLSAKGLTPIVIEGGIKAVQEYTKTAE